MTFYSPLEQYDIIPLIVLKLGNLNVSFTNSSLYIFFAVSLTTIIVLFSTYKATVIPGKWQSIVEMVYEFIQGLVSENLGRAGQKYFPFIFTLFTFLLVSNLLGMIPYSFTPSSHIIVTFGLSLSIFIGVTILGFLHHGMHFFSFFLPQGAPLALAPLLVGIELISYISRAFSLGIRLFANMMSGHTLLKIISSFAWTMLGMGGFIYIAGFLPIGLLFVLTGLEIGIAMLQAYVFTILTCIYLSDSIHLH